MNEAILWSELDDEALERLLLATVVPRPTVWVTTVGASDGAQANIAPFSSILPIMNRPPCLLLAIQRRSNGSRKRTAENILQTRQFVVNVLDERQIRGAIRALDLGVPPHERFHVAGIGQIESRYVKPPRVDGCCAAIECSLTRDELVGDSVLRR